MNILALETSTMACSVALQSGSILVERHAEEQRAHARIILGMVDQLLAQSGLTLKSLDAIAYGAGPGSFTGVRIGLSVAQGLGFSNDLPLVPVSSLAAVANTSLCGADEKAVRVAQDARMGEIYSGRYAIRDGQLIALEAERLCAASDLELRGDDLLAGDGWERDPVLRAFASDRQIVARWPEARATAQLGAVALRAGRGVQAEAATVNYLRDSVAQSM